MNRIKSIVALMVSLAVLTGCATRWIDKVAQTRVTITELGYKSVAEFNGYYGFRTNLLQGTTPDLEAARSLVYETSRNLGTSLLVLEAAETTYRVQPTNQNQVVSALAAVGQNASNIVEAVRYVTKGTQ